jgi:hypothetical protein
MKQSDLFKKLLIEAYKDMNPSEQADFLKWCLDYNLKNAAKVLIDTKHGEVIDLDHASS